MSLITSVAPHRSGLLELVRRAQQYLEHDWVRKKYADQGARLPVFAKTGWKQREQNFASPEGGNRLLVIPGHGSGTRLQHGALEQPRHSGIGTPGYSTSYAGGARAEFSWPRKFILSVWSYDGRDDRDEELQIEASDQLLELAVNALVAAGNGSVRPAGDIYQDEFSPNAPFGIELLVPMTHSSPLYGLPHDVITDVSLSVNGQIVTNTPLHAP